jgi:hypothetical protein
MMSSDGFLSHIPAKRKIALKDFLVTTRFLYCRVLEMKTCKNWI